MEKVCTLLFGDCKDIGRADNNCMKCFYFVVLKDENKKDHNKPKKIT